MIANLNPDSWEEKFQKKRHQWHWSAPASDHNATYLMRVIYPQSYVLYGLFDIVKFILSKAHPTIFRRPY